MDKLDYVERTMRDIKAFDMGMSSEEYKKLIDEVFDRNNNAQNKQREGKGSIQP